MVLADAAADAQLSHNPRPLHRHPFPLRVLHLLLLQPDRFLRHRAHLFADDARPGVGPGDAAILVNVGHADDRLPLLLQRQLGDSPGRTNLAAGVAGVVAVAQARHQHRRPQPFQAGRQQARLQARRGADLEALAAADALVQQIVLPRPGRADEVRMLPARGRRGAQQPDAGHCRAQRGQHLPSRGIVASPGSQAPAPAEADGLRGAARQAIEAHRALGGVGGEVALRINGARGTDAGATLAGRAGRFVHPVAQPGHLAEQPQQRSQRAEIAAPEARTNGIERQHAHEDQGQQQVLLEEALLQRQQPAPHEAVEDFQWRLQRPQAVKRRLRCRDQGIQRRQRRGGHRAEQQREGIEDQQGQVAQQRGEEDGEEQEVLDLPPAGGPVRIVRTGPPQPRPIQQRAQRAEPAAPDAAQPQGQQQRHATQSQRRHPAPAGEHGRQPRQRIEPEEQIMRQEGRTTLPRPQQQVQKQQQRQKLYTLPHPPPRNVMRNA